MKSQIKTEHGDLRGSISIIEAWLNELQLDYDTRIIKNLRMIQRLRSKKYPIYVDTPEFVEALQYFGLTFPVTDWQGLWEAVLGAYLEALEGVEQALRRWCEQKL